jgi:cardiolipin synthase
MKPAALILMIFFVLFSSGVCAGATIIEFCPDTYLSGDSDEYVVIDTGDSPIGDLMVSDGEGGFRFSPESARGRVTVALNGSAFELIHRTLPDFEVFNSSPTIPDVISGGTFRLANERDELLLYQNGRLIQEVRWPEDLKPREGQVHYYQDSRWDQRVLLIGQSRLHSAEFSGVSGVAAVSPDCATGLLITTINLAKSELLVNVYEFTDTTIADALCRAAERGVNITVLLEGGPVGGISSSEFGVISRLSSAGISVRQMGNVGVVHAPYRFDHAKYMVIDGESVFVTSENFGVTGFPAEGLSGNRGWSVLLNDRDLANYFWNMYLHDAFEGYTSDIRGEGTLETMTSSPHNVEFSTFPFKEAKVTPVIAPDTSNEILTLIEHAIDRIDIEQAYITNESPGIPNPYLAAAINASRRGVHVRILLDSYWYNVEDEADNDEMIEYINGIAKAERLPLEAKCAELAGNDLEKIHNKGVLVDGQKVLVSSINWNTNSPTSNREVGVIIEEPSAAAYYERAFEDDWNAGIGSRTGADYLKLILFGVIVISLCLIYLRKRK